MHYSGYLAYSIIVVATLFGFQMRNVCTVDVHLSHSCCCAHCGRGYDYYRVEIKSVLLALILFRRAWYREHKRVAQYLPALFAPFPGIAIVEVQIEQLSPKTFDVSGVVDALQKKHPCHLGPDMVSVNQVCLR